MYLRPEIYNRIPIYLANHLCSNFCLNPEIQLRGGSGGISALGRIFQFGQIFRNLRRAIPILRGARAVNCGKTSQIAKPKRFEEFGRKSRISGGNSWIRAEKAGFGRKKPDSGRFSRKSSRTSGGKTHGIDTRRGGFGGFFCSVFFFALAFRDSQRIGRRADFGASGGFSEVGRFFCLTTRRAEITP